MQARPSLLPSQLTHFFYWWRPLRNLRRRILMVAVQEFGMRMLVVEF
jgi:hypothetical protein